MVVRIPAHNLAVYALSLGITFSFDTMEFTVLAIQERAEHGQDGTVGGGGLPV
jgi:hypothetical protein